MKINLTTLLIAFSGISIAQNSLPEVSSGKLFRIENFKSEYVSSRSIDVWVPAHYDGNKKFAVLYMHDGQLLYDAATTWNKHLHVPLRFLLTKQEVR